MKSMKICIMFFLLVLNVSVSALTVYVDPGSWSGLRSTDTTGIVAAGSWSGVNNPGFQIKWDIGINFYGGYDYVYTISGEGGADLGKSLSHWILEVTNPALMSDFTNINRNVEYGPDTHLPTSGNFNMPGSIYGFKDETTLLEEEMGDTLNYVFSFNTYRAPVWGDFYAKDGKTGGVWNTAYNSGFGQDPTIETTDFSDWIARPNGHTNEVPEASSIILLALGILGFIRMNPRKLG